MKFDIESQIVLNDIPGVNRKTGEPSAFFLLAKYIDECHERGVPATGAQVIAKFSDLAGGERIDVPRISTLVSNISRRLHPGR